MIGDNGEGMDEKMIAKFATFSLSIEDRGIKKNTRDTFKHRFVNSQISKYGVGAKQAGCYLARRIVVLSRRGDAREGTVLEFGIDKDQMIKQARSGDSNVYEGKVTSNFKCMPLRRL
jgi:hypothetical protein